MDEDRPEFGETDNETHPTGAPHPVDSIDLDVLGRYLMGEAPWHERAELEARMAADASVQAWVDYMRRKLTSEPATHDLSTVILVQRAADMRRAAEHVQQDVVGGVSPRHTRMSGYIATTIGASAILLLGITWAAVRGAHVISRPAAQVYASSPGHRLSVTLVDGTRLTLGPDSRVRVPATYASQDRTVDLEGEGYFTVVHNPVHPFAVRTRRGVTRDVGTVFGVREYGEDGNTQVAVEEGVVTVASGICQVSACTLTMRRGQVGSISDRGAELRPGLDVSTVVGWMQNQLVFQDTPLAEVARTLGRTFDLDVQVADSGLARETVTGAFATESASVVLESITGVVGATYHQSGRTIVIRRNGFTHERKSEQSAAPLKVARAGREQE